jgi:hypothetical protein
MTIDQPPSQPGQAVSWPPVPPWTPAPAVGWPAPPSAKEVRTEGIDVRVVILRFRKFHLRTDTGRIYEFIVLVRPPTGGNFVLQIGSPVPTEAQALIEPYLDLPAKLHRRDQRALIIDWAAALSEAPSEVTPPAP